MKPIDADELIEETKITKGEYKTEFGKGMGKAFELVWEWIERGDFNLPPGTLIIQREEGYDRGDCYDCIAWNDDYYSCNLEMFKSKSERCSYKGDKTKINCRYENVKDTRECRTCRYVKPCKYHTTEEELKNSYITGGDE